MIINTAVDIRLCFIRLSAVEMFFYNLHHQVGVLFEALTDIGILEGLEVLDDVVDHVGIEHAMLLEDAAVGGELVGGFGAGGGKLVEAFEAGFVFRPVDVDIHIRPLSQFKRFLHLEAMAGGHHNTGKQQVDVGGTIRASELDRLLLGVIHIVGLLLGIGHGDHVFGAGPAERHTHQHGAVAVAPADGGGSLLMGNKAEVGGGVGVAEGRKRRSTGHIAGDGVLGNGVEFALGHHLVLAAFDNTGVDMETAAGLAAGDFGSEGYIKAVLVGEVADDPFGENELICSILHIGDEELYFILLINLVAEGEVAHFGVAVLDETAHL